MIKQVLLKFVQRIKDAGYGAGGGGCEKATIPKQLNVLAICNLNQL